MKFCTEVGGRRHKLICKSLRQEVSVLLVGVEFQVSLTFRPVPATQLLLTVQPVMWMIFTVKELSCCIFCISA